VNNGVILDNPTVVFTKDPFIEDQTDSRIVTMSGSDKFTIILADKLAANNTSFPDVDEICFAYTVTPENSIYYTTTTTLTYEFSFLYCDAIFPESETYEYFYQIENTTLEFYHFSKDTSRCSFTSYDVKMRLDFGSEESIDTDLFTWVEDSATKSATI
jgi:hypothetical protein